MPANSKDIDQTASKTLVKQQSATNYSFVVVIEVLLMKLQYVSWQVICFISGSGPVCFMPLIEVVVP